MKHSADAMCFCCYFLSKFINIFFKYKRMHFIWYGLVFFCAHSLFAPFIDTKKLLCNQMKFENKKQCHSCAPIYNSLKLLRWSKKEKKLKTHARTHKNKSLNATKSTWIRCLSVCWAMIFFSFSRNKSFCFCKKQNDYGHIWLLKCTE